MIDSVLCAKLPPKLKRSVNIARLQNGTYEKIVAHLERELELNALGESDDLPIATTASVSTNTGNLLSNGNDTNEDAQCCYFKARNGRENGKKPLIQTYPPCETRGRKNHPPERCWQGAGAHLRPERTRPDDKANDASGDEGTAKKENNPETSTSSQPNLKQPDSKN